MLYHVNSPYYRQFLSNGLKYLLLHTIITIGEPISNNNNINNNRPRIYIPPAAIRETLTSPHIPNDSFNIVKHCSHLSNKF